MCLTRRFKKNFVGGGDAWHGGVVDAVGGALLMETFCRATKKYSIEKIL